MISQYGKRAYGVVEGVDLQGFKKQTQINRTPILKYGAEQTRLAIN